MLTEGLKKGDNSVPRAPVHFLEKTERRAARYAWSMQQLHVSLTPACFLTTVFII